MKKITTSPIEGFTCCYSCFVLLLVVVGVVVVVVVVAVVVLVMNNRPYKDRKLTLFSQFFFGWLIFYLGHQFPMIIPNGLDLQGLPDMESGSRPCS